MRILHVTQSFLPSIGGMEWVVHHLSNALVARGHDVHVLRSHAPGAACGDLQPFNPHYDVHDYPFGFRFGEALGRNMRALTRSIRNLISGDRFDLVHAHMLHYPGWAALCACRPQAMPVVVTEHGQYIVSQKPGPDQASRGVRRSLRKALMCVDNLTSPGSENLQFLLEDRGAPPPRHPIVLPNGLHLPPRTEMGSIHQSRSPNMPKMLMVARWHPIKQLQHGVEALALLVDQLKATGIRAIPQLTIIGSGNRENLQPLASRLGVGEHVRFAEASGQDLWPHYASHDIYWMTSRRESMGLTKYEAMGFGQACVVNDVPGCREHISHGETGLLYTPNDPADLARQTLRLLTDPGLLARLGTAGLAIAEPLRWENLILEYERYYELVLSDRNNQRSTGA